MTEKKHQFSSDVLIQLSVHKSSKDEKGNYIFHPVDSNTESFSITIDADDDEQAKQISIEKLKKAVKAIK